MKKVNGLFAALLLITACTTQPYERYTPAAESALRAPAYPLVTIDPYTCVWSFSDQLNEEETKHWTGKAMPLLGGLRVDGISYRFLGHEEIPLLPVVETAVRTPWQGQYTETAPAGDWTAVDYDDSGWKAGTAAFGTDDTPARATPWLTSDIWVRRSFDLPKELADETLYLQFSHDDNVEIYINGTPVATTGHGYEMNLLRQLPKELVKALKPTGNIIAAHCLNNTGGAYLDFGIMKKVDRGDTFEAKAQQLHAHVMPTQTYYTFACGPVELELIFTAPFLPDDLHQLSAPYNYLTYQVRATDGKEHEVEIYFEATPQWAVNTIEQRVAFNKQSERGITSLTTGTLEQPMLEKQGDDLRIDWGYFYLSAPDAPHVTMEMGEYYAVKKDFMTNGSLTQTTSPAALSGDMEREMTVLAYAAELGKVTEDYNGGFLMLGYDDRYSIQYFGENRQAYWTRDGAVTIADALEKGAADYHRIMTRCREFDASLMADATRAGGKKYAELCALAYRQSIAAHKLVTDSNGELLFFSKENFSNGSIGTVDITYPSSPLYLLYNIELLKGMMNPIFYYSESGRWTKPFAAHDVGTYPRANGQTYGGDMPVEESGNMLILTTAIALREGNAAYAQKHWEVLSVWADYLRREGLDPANQLCTDDFAGHFAHNTNLSIKAIMGVAGYGKLAEMLGKTKIAEEYTQAAREMATQWVTMADDNDHYRLTFDQPGTWSQKYNMVWDRILGFNLFPQEVAQKEMQYYRGKQNRFGLPLDNREDYTKSDWILWTACLTGSDADFTTLMEPVWEYAHTTDSRVPLSDWHFTSTGGQRGFQARSVVGGYFMKLLIEEMKKTENH